MSARSTRFSIAPFRFDVTPPLGHPLLGGWIPAAHAIDDSLEAIGYVLLGAGAPIVVCVVDWAALLNRAHHAWCAALAAAAGTTPDRVAVHCVHQHNAPFVCPEADTIARQEGQPATFDPAFFSSCLVRGAEAVRAALREPRAVAHVAHGQAEVRQVASNRRIARDPDGRVTAMRRSACTDSTLVALPEGVIDPMLQTIALLGPDGEKVVACHYYATHPMSFYRDGRVTSDFCGLARKRRQAEEPQCTHLYFTGCAGDVSAGKYNDGSPAARLALTDRMHAGMRAAEAALVPRPLDRVAWRSAHVLPPPAPDRTPRDPEAGRTHGVPSLAERVIPAYRRAWRERHARGTPLAINLLHLADVAVLHLPAEMFVEFQLRARRLRRAGPLAVAAYGDNGPWYVPPRDEYARGGYEVEMAFAAPAAGDLFNAAIERLILEPAPPAGPP